MPGRSTRLNLRRTHKWLAAIRDEVDPHLFISLDAEKAFYALHLPFLHSTLRRFGFGTTFSGWVALLYQTPVASVRVNGVLSRSLHIQRGTREGCPLSPLLFVLTLEPLACQIGGQVDILGLRSRERRRWRKNSPSTQMIFCCS